MFEKPVKKPQLFKKGLNLIKYFYLLCKSLTYCIKTAFCNCLRFFTPGLIYSLRSLTSSRMPDDLILRFHALSANPKSSRAVPTTLTANEFPGTTCW